MRIITLVYKVRAFYRLLLVKETCDLAFWAMLRRRSFHLTCRVSFVLMLTLLSAETAVQYRMDAENITRFFRGAAHDMPRQCSRQVAERTADAVRPTVSFTATLPLTRTLTTACRGTAVATRPTASFTETLPLPLTLTLTLALISYP